MKKYRVRVYFTASDVVIVETEDEDKALEEACVDFNVMYDDVEVEISNSYVIEEIITDAVS